MLSKKYRSLVLSILLSAIVTSGNVHAAGSGGTANAKPFVELQGQIIEVQGKIVSLQEQIDALVAKVNSIEERVGADEAAIALLQNQNIFLQAQIDANADDVEALKVEITKLQAENAVINEKILNNSGNIDLLKAKLEENNNLILVLQQRISGLYWSLQSQITNNLALIRRLYYEIETIESFLALKQNLINGYCPSGQAIREVLSNGNVVCEVVNVNFNGLTVYEVWSPVTTVLAGQHVGAYATCPDGTMVTGGGYRLPVEADVTLSQPNPVNSWAVGVQNNRGERFDFLSVAMCLGLQP